MLDNETPERFPSEDDSEHRGKRQRATRACKVTLDSFFSMSVKQNLLYR